MIRLETLVNIKILKILLDLYFIFHAHWKIEEINKLPWGRQVSCSKDFKGSLWHSTNMLAISLFSTHPFPFACAVSPTTAIGIIPLGSRIHSPNCSSRACFLIVATLTLTVLIYSLCCLFCLTFSFILETLEYENTEYMLRTLSLVQIVQRQNPQVQGFT